MSGPRASRRAVLTSLLLVGPGLAATPAGLWSARADDARTFGSVAVDVGPLRALGLGPVADEVGGALRTALLSAFADRIGTGRPERATSGRPAARASGPRLVVRLTALSVRSYVGGDGVFGPGAAFNNDYLEGVAAIVGTDGRVLAEHPQLSALPASSGGAWYDPASEHRRLVALAEHFAGWLRRAL